MSLSSIILAGGKSSRMGRDKAFLPFKGKPFLRHILETLAPVSSEIIIVANKDKSLYEPLWQDLNVKVKFLTDKAPYEGPLNGIATASKAVSNEKVFIATCDTPIIKPEVINFLLTKLTGYEGVIPVVNQKFQPLNTVYTKQAINKAQSIFERGEKSLMAWIKKLNVLSIEEKDILLYDPKLITYRSLNTPEDYQKFVLEFEN